MHNRRFLVIAGVVLVALALFQSQREAVPSPTVLGQADNRLDSPLPGSVMSTQASQQRAAGIRSSDTLTQVKPESSYRKLMTKEWPQGEMDWSPEGMTPEQLARKIASQLGDEEYLARHVSGARPAQDLERQVEMLRADAMALRNKTELGTGIGPDDAASLLSIYEQLERTDLGNRSRTKKAGLTKNVRFAHNGPSLAA